MQATTSSNYPFPFFGVWRVLEFRLSGGWEKFELSQTKRGAPEKNIFDSKRVEDIRLKLAPPWATSACAIASV